MQLKLGVKVRAHNILNVGWERDEEGVGLGGGALSAASGPVCA